MVCSTSWMPQTAARGTSAQSCRLRVMLGSPRAKSLTGTPRARWSLRRFALAPSLKTHLILRSGEAQEVGTTPDRCPQYS